MDKESTPIPYRFRFRDGPRIVVKVAVILAWTATVAATLAVAWLPTLAARSGSVWRARMRRRAYRIWARGTLFSFGVQVLPEGKPPPPGCLVVSNHLSYLDIVVLASLLPVIFVSKAEVRQWPFWGLMATLAGTVFIDRNRKRDTLRVLDAMQRAFDRGDSVLIFPEATSTKGATILPLKSSLLATASAQEDPVYWLTVSYRTPKGSPRARDRVCWWGNAGFIGHFFGLCSLRRVHCTVRFGDSSVRCADRKALAKHLRNAMLGRFEPVP